MEEPLSIKLVEVFTVERLAEETVKIERVREWTAFENTLSQGGIEMGQLHQVFPQRYWVLSSPDDVPPGRVTAPRVIISNSLLADSETGSFSADSFSSPLFSHL